MNRPIKSGVAVQGQLGHLNGFGSQQNFHHGQIVGHALHPVASANGRMRRMFSREQMFPFRLYQLPSWYRATPDPATDWLKWCVRGGSVFINWVETAATGTDGETSPYSETFPLSAGSGVGEVSLTSGTAKWWFWLDLSGGTTAVVANGSTPPAWDSAHIPIGYVDTAASASAHIAIARQYVCEDVFACP